MTGDFFIKRCYPFPTLEEAITIAKIAAENGNNEYSVNANEWMLAKGKTFYTAYHGDFLVGFLMLDENTKAFDVHTYHYSRMAKVDLINATMRDGIR